MPSDAINPETPAKQGSVVEIQCQTDTEYDSCIFTHTNPFYVGQNIQQDTIVSMRIYLLSFIYFLSILFPGPRRQARDDQVHHQPRLRRHLHPVRG